MLSPAKVWAVARYEITWDMRKKRTYFIVSLFFFTALAYGYLLPIVAGKSITTAPFNEGVSVDSSLWWVNSVYLVFNTFLVGIFPLLIGGFISSDSLASEFNKSTIVPLLSQPIRRIELYLGKLLEKVLLLIVVSAMFTLLVLATADVSVGAQAQLYWLPVVVFAGFGAFLEYAALAFFFGSFVRSGSMVLGILIALLLVLSGTITVLALHTGEQESMFLLPILNAASLTHVIPYYIFQPTGDMVLKGAFMGTYTPAVSVTAISALEYALAGLALNATIPIIAGYYIFRRKEVKG